MKTAAALQHAVADPGANITAASTASGDLQRRLQHAHMRQCHSLVDVGDFSVVVWWGSGAGVRKRQRKRCTGCSCDVLAKGPAG